MSCFRPSVHTMFWTGLLFWFGLGVALVGSVIDSAAVL